MPLGLMAAWLSVGTMCGDKPEHWVPECFDHTQERRLAARRELELCEGTAALAAYEQREATDPPEPAASK